MGTNGKDDSIGGVAARRRRLGLTQQQAAKRAEVPLRTWRQVETSGTSGVDTQALRRVARTLGVAAWRLNTLPSELDDSNEPLVRLADTNDQFAIKLNGAFAADPLTPRQALGLLDAASEGADIGELWWHELASGEVTADEVWPYSRLPLALLFTVNLTWLNQFRRTFQKLHDRLDAGETPYPECTADEVALRLCLDRAETGDFWPLYPSEVATGLDHYGEAEGFERLDMELFQDTDFEMIWSSTAVPDAVVEAAGITDGTLDHFRWWEPF